MLQGIFIVLAVIGVGALVVVNIVAPFWFHLSNRKLPPAPKIDHKPDPRPAKLISKEEAYSERAVYDYERTSMMGAPVAPIEPGDSDPPEPYE